MILSTQGTHAKLPSQSFCALVCRSSNILIFSACGEEAKCKLSARHDFLDPSDYIISVDSFQVNRRSYLITTTGRGQLNLFEFNGIPHDQDCRDGFKLIQTALPF